MNVILCDDYDIYLFVLKDKYCLFLMVHVMNTIH